MRRVPLHPVCHSKQCHPPSGRVGEGCEKLSDEAERERQEGLGAQAKEGLLAGTWNGHGHGLSKTILHVPFRPPVPFCPAFPRYRGSICVS